LIILPSAKDRASSLRLRRACYPETSRKRFPLLQYGVVATNRPLLTFIILIVVGFPAVSAFNALAGQTNITKPSSNNLAETVITEPAETIPAQPSAGHPRVLQLTFGSQAILDSCWSAQELQGSSEDRKIVKSGTPRFRPFPGRTLPKNTLEALSDELQNSIRSVKPVGNLKFVALTFDLCENTSERTGYDADIVNYLRRYQVKATFFTTGKWMLSHSAKTLQLMADPLFEIGNHGWTHGNFRTLDRQRISEEVLWTQAQYELLWEELEAKPCAKSTSPDEILKIPKVPLTFRFPFGTCNKEALDFLARSGLPAIQWTVVTGDAAPRQSADAISREILEKTRPGSIIICHANGRGHATAEALPLFIPKLLQSGYKFVTISELLAFGSTFAVSECYEIKPGDNLRYDRRSGVGNK
jgi:peptidoglycan-N-acetylglucosamine deacetylase